MQKYLRGEGGCGWKLFQKPALLNALDCVWYCHTVIFWLLGRLSDEWDVLSQSNAAVFLPLCHLLPALQSSDFDRKILMNPLTADIWTSSPPLGVDRKIPNKGFFPSNFPVEEYLHNMHELVRNMSSCCRCFLFIFYYPIFPSRKLDAGSRCNSDGAQCLSSTHEALGSIPALHALGVVAHMYNPSTLEIEAENHKVKIITNYMVSSRLPLNTWDSASKQQQILFCFVCTRQSIWVCVLAWPLNHMGESESFPICSLVPDSDMTVKMLTQA